ncbi:hypothetical protein [Tengunoibacter tsumagoiensis]|uniref:Uncharacterized protein n=1 Tax=Tengunoibacter tsumagoiensis TaxID=2014871 RepID=A0A401ZUP6_9CHLR|nr:hypothetical protein [Tengunoibacter tsumagoiensis]GCE10522.1 hypothetical protein KTT_03810 [Tengunoibacter tsumagoiensis]
MDTSPPPLRCDCCGTPVDVQAASVCRTCGYPVDRVQEIVFLQQQVQNLQRVADHGGAQITIAQLIERYRRRLLQLTQASVVAQSPSEEKPLAPANAVSSEQPLPGDYPAATPPPSAGSPQSFLTEQSNVVIASLGAFFILIGSLSFLFTTKNSAQAFIVLLIVHVIFGAIGVVSYRFPRFRTVGIIYTGIFALQVPLVGYSAYQLVVGAAATLSAPTLVMIAALYATIVYVALALYQRFSVFGYLAAVAFFVADLAFLLVTNLNFWWYAIILFVPAFVSLVEIPRLRLRLDLQTTHPPILRGALLFLRYTSLILACISGFLTLIYALGNGLEVTSGLQREMRIAFLVFCLLLFVWVMAYTWLARARDLAGLLPWLATLNVLAGAYLYEASRIDYVFISVGLAGIYHLTSVVLPRSGRLAFPGVRKQLDILTLSLVLLIPCLVDLFLPFQIVQHSYHLSLFFNIQPDLSWETWAGIASILLGCLISISLVFTHTGFQKVLTPEKRNWPYVLIISGLLVTFVYGLVLLLWGKNDFVWWYLALALVWIVFAIAIRRLVNQHWAYPFDCLALLTTIGTLLLGFELSPDQKLIVLLGLATIYYAVLLYQRRALWLFLPVVLAICAFPSLWERPYILALFSFVLPLLTAGVRNWMGHKSREITPWEAPLMTIALLYGLLFVVHDGGLNTSSLQSWLGRPFALPLELAGLGAVWYLAAVWGRVSWWQWATILYTVPALLFPPHNFWILIWIAPILALLGFAVSKGSGRQWAAAPYSLSVLAVLIVGTYSLLFREYDPKITAIVPFVLFGYVLIAYSLIFLEKVPLLIWPVIGLTAWSVLSFPESELHWGSGEIALLAMLVFLYGRWQHRPVRQRGSLYGVGLLVALIGTWELWAWQQYDVALLVLFPASYLISIAPFVDRDSVLKSPKDLSNACAIVGALLLLLPTLWSSFGPHDLLVSLLLVGESLLLFILGTISRIRFFVLSGAAIVIVGAIHLLFLPSLGIPTFLAFMLVGVLLLVMATLLLLIRSRLTAPTAS